MESFWNFEMQTEPEITFYSLFIKAVAIQGQQIHVVEPKKKAHGISGMNWKRCGTACRE